MNKQKSTVMDFSEETRKIGASETEDFDINSRKRSQFKDVVGRLFRNKLAVVAFCIVAIIILVAIFADVLAPYGYAAQDPTSRFLYPCAAHPLGTDNYGRDILSRIIYGARISLLVSLLAVSMSLVVGSFLGATAGYLGGTYETVIMRIMDIFMAIPGFLMAVTVQAALGTGMVKTAFAIAISAVPSFCRLMRSSVLTIKDLEYIDAARVMGNSKMRIILIHIIPNTLSPIIVQCTLRIGATILAISGLSFIGLGVQPPTPEWGSMLASGREFIRDFWPIVTFPGIAIMLTMFGFNIFGDALRDALDPKLKQ